MDMNANKKSYLYTVLAGALPFLKNEKGSFVKDVYRDAFREAQRLGCRCFKEGEGYSLILFDDVFKIDRCDLDGLKNETVDKVGKPAAAVDVKNENDERRETQNNNKPAALEQPEGIAPSDKEDTPLHNNVAEVISSESPERTPDDFKEGESAPQDNKPHENKRSGEDGVSVTVPGDRPVIMDEKDAIRHSIGDFVNSSKDKARNVGFGMGMKRRVGNSAPEEDRMIKMERLKKEGLIKSIKNTNQSEASSDNTGGETVSDSLVTATGEQSASSNKPGIAEPAQETQPVRSRSLNFIPNASKQRDASSNDHNEEPANGAASNDSAKDTAEKVSVIPAKEMPNTPVFEVIEESRVERFLRDVYDVTVRTYKVDSNTEERVFEKSISLRITVYPLTIKNESLTAPILAIIEDKTVRKTYVAPPNTTSNSLICEFGKYCFIIRGGFEDPAAFKSSIVPYKETAEQQRFEVITQLNSGLSERPDNIHHIGHPVIRIGEHFKIHFVPQVISKEKANSVEHCIIINEHDGIYEKDETSDHNYIIKQLNKEYYQMYSGWDNGLYRGELKNITDKIKNRDNL